MAAWRLCSMGGVVHHIPVPPFFASKRTELWHSMAPHPPAYNFNLLTYKDSQQLYPFQVSNCWGFVVVVVWSSPPSSVATGAHPFPVFFSSFLSTFLPSSLNHAVWWWALEGTTSLLLLIIIPFLQPNLSPQVLLLQTSMILPRCGSPDRHQSNRKLTHKKPTSFLSKFTHSIHSFIMCWVRIIDLEACGIKSLDEGSSGSAIVAECGEADFCLEQVIG